MKMEVSMKHRPEAVKNKVRLTISVPSNTRDLIEAIAKERGSTMSEVVRSSVLLANTFLEHCSEENGGHIELVSKDGTRTRAFFG